MVLFVIKLIITTILEGLHVPNSAHVKGKADPRSNSTQGLHTDNCLGVKGETNNILGQKAGVSGKTISRIEYIEKNATEEDKRVYIRTIVWV